MFIHLHLIDAKGLLIAAINDPNPFCFLSTKLCTEVLAGNVPEEYYEIEIGKARLVREGDDMSIITYGAGVHWAMDYAENIPKFQLIYLT